MAKNRESRPELDYDLLVERHERFRSRQTQKAPGQPASGATPKTAAPQASAAEPPKMAQQPAPQPDAEEDASAPAETPVGDVPTSAGMPGQDVADVETEAYAPQDGDAPDAYDLGDEYDEEAGIGDDGSEAPADPNPFGSILSFISRSREAIGNHLRRKHGNEAYEDYDEEDEEGVGLDGDTDAAPEAEAPLAEGDAPDAAGSAPQEAPVENGVLFDIPEDDMPAAPVPSDEEAQEEALLDAEDDEDVEEDDGEDAPDSALVRFLHLFIDRADDEDDEESAGEGDGYAPYAYSQPAGGDDSMQQPRKLGPVDTEMTQLMAEGLGERTLSRKERRALQQQQDAEPSPVVRDLDSDAQGDRMDEPTREFRPISRERAAMAAQGIEPPASLFDDGEAEEEEIEPPISRRAQRRAEKARRLAEEEDSYDDEDDEDGYDDEPPKKRSRRRDDYDDEDGYDDEPPKKRSRRRDDYDDEDGYDDEPPKKRSRRRDDYDDEDGYDDEPPKKRSRRRDDYDDEDGYDDEPPKKRSRRRDDYDDEDGYDDELPKKRSRRRDDYDDEDGYEDGYDDEDDYDEPVRGRRGHHSGHSRRDSYDDDYDDDYDDYDDYDDDDYDDDGPHSFGHYLLGFFKTVFWILLALIIIIVGLNLLHKTGTIDISGLRDTVHGWSPSMGDILFFAVEDDAPDAALPEGSTPAGDTAAGTQLPSPDAQADVDTTVPDDAQGATGDAQTGADDAPQSGLAPAPAA